MGGGSTNPNHEPREDPEIDASALTIVPGLRHGGTIVSDERAGAPHKYQLQQNLTPETRYARSSLHASGGMGMVWLARDAHIGRDVALKELREEAVSAAAISERFVREARITGRLEHPGIVPVYELGSDPGTGRPFYTMRFVRGRTLTQAAQEFHQHRIAGHDDPLDFVALLGAFTSVCNTIAYAHSHGIVHRDLKGENIVLGDFGEVIVLDWGLAKQMGGEDFDTDEFTVHIERDLLPNASHTMMGQVMGTPAYMAPEQAQGRLDLIGPSTDIFGAGAILYEILTGHPPFSGANTTEVLTRAQRVEVVSPSSYWPDAPPALEAACLKAMSETPADRYPTASALGREVQGWQDRQRRKAEDDLRQAGKRLMHQQAALVKLTRSEVFAETDITNIFLRMIEVSARTLGVSRVSVWRYSDDRRAIRCSLLYELSTGNTSSGIELGAEMFPSYFEALLTSEVIPAHDAKKDPRTCEFTESYLNPLGIGAIMDAPIHVGGDMKGVVCHEHIGGPRTWHPDEQLFAIAIANLVAQAISQSEERNAPGHNGS